MSEEKSISKVIAESMQGLTIGFASMVNELLLIEDNLQQLLPTTEPSVKHLCINLGFVQGRKEEMMNAHLTSLPLTAKEDLVEELKKGGEFVINRSGSQIAFSWAMLLTMANTNLRRTPEALAIWTMAEALGFYGKNGFLHWKAPDEKTTATIVTREIPVVKNANLLITMLAYEQLIIDTAHGRISFTKPQLLGLFNLLGNESPIKASRNTIIDLAMLVGLVRVENCLYWTGGDSDDKDDPHLTAMISST